MKLLSCVLILAFAWCAVAQAQMVVKYPRPQSENDTRYAYHTALLKEALRRTQGQYGLASVEPAAQVMNELRIARFLQEGVEEIDVMYKPASKDLELKLRPVRVPLDRGLLGWRVFLIRQQDQAKFAEVESLEDLRQFTVGQGQTWTDVEIYRHNNLPVVTGGSYEGLFKMLMKGHFDYFARGVEEAPYELEARKEQFPDMFMEQTIALYYPFPRYMWVGNNAKGDELLLRLTEGLESMVADGSLQQMFFDYKRDALRQVRLKTRKVLKIENPFLPDTAPLDRQELWFDPLQ